MKKYTTYKDSGIEWIGDIPEHWGRVKLKVLVDPKICDGPHETPEWTLEGIPFLSAEAIKGNKVDINFKRGFISLEQHKIYSQKSKVQKGDVLFCKSGSTTGKSALVETDEEFGIWSPLAIIRANEKCNNIFLFQFLQSEIFKLQVETGWTFGTQPNIGMGSLENLWITLPPIDEQKNIAKYLDKKTSEIENLINKKKQLIALLKEERTAIINNAVTKGINPNVKLKDSGVEWIGEIPEHWDIKRMKYLCDIGTGSKDTENREENGVYPFFVRSQTVESISTYSYEGEAILTAGDGVGVCKVWHYINGRFDYHQRVYRMSDFVGILGKFLFYYIKENFEKEVFKLSARSTVDSLRRPMFQNFMVCFGSIQEQKEIVEYIESKISEIDIIISKTEKEIELMKEYKTALISEVVTGKIDVREEVLS